MPFLTRKALVITLLGVLAVIAAVSLLLVPVTLSHNSSYSIATHRSSHGLYVDREMSDLRRDRHAGDSSAEGLFGHYGEAGRDPDNNPAVEQAINRAYPLTEIPISFTQAAAATFAKLKSNRGNRTPLTWQLLGPNYAIQPSVLTFTSLSGVNGANYVASGRVTAMAIAPTCTPNQCRLWVGAAGGGVWRTDHALAGSPTWVALTNGITSNAIGVLTVDPNDPSGKTIYAGTGEPNASADSEAGTGVFKSEDGGDTWTPLTATLTPAGTLFGRAISSIVVAPNNSNTIYITVARAIRGMTAVNGGATSNPPASTNPALFGLYRSMDGGLTFTRIWDGNASIRGVNHVELDPTNPTTTIYAAAFQQGIWRSTDGGSTWTQIFVPTSLLAPSATDRSEFVVTTLSNSKTRMYVGDGAVGFFGSGSASSHVFRSDDVTATTPVFTDLTSNTNGNPGYATFDFCTGQCWYDNLLATPTGFPDHIWIGGSYAYGELGGRSNGRAVVRSTTAGNPDPNNNNRTFTDLTWDGEASPQELHPDMHALVFDPSNPNIAFIGSDGGVVRTDGTFVDISSECDTRPIGPASMLTCHRLLSAVPGKLFNVNRNLSTLQFQSLSVNPLNPTGEVLGGTQDNGTWHYVGSSNTWYQTIYGDGGQSGFDATTQNVMFNEFTSNATDSNFRDGLQTAWVVVSGPLAQSGENAPFYSAIIQDPAVSGTRFFGMNHVWRTKDNGGNQAFLEANCPEFTTSFDNPNCGDWVALGSTTLTTSTLGTRAGGAVAALARITSDSSTLWAATQTGRVFISKNADANPASSVTFTRLDVLSAAAPGRFVSGIWVDPANPNHAWISYSGYSESTPTTPGHVFEVLYDPIGGTATWTNIDPANSITGTGTINTPVDLPVTALVRDDQTGDLYAATDFGVARLPFGQTAWEVPPGLPIVEVAGLSISSSGRRLYAATHGRSAWALPLP